MFGKAKNKSLIYMNPAKRKAANGRAKVSEETHRVLSIYRSNYSKLELSEVPEKDAKPQVKMSLHMRDLKSKKHRKELLKSVNLKRSRSRL